MKRTPLILILSLLSGVLTPFAFLTAAEDDSAEIEFSKHIAPLLKQHCLRCHSARNRRGEISLATFLRI